MSAWPYENFPRAWRTVAILLLVVACDALHRAHGDLPRAVPGLMLGAFAIGVAVGGYLPRKP